MRGPRLVPDAPPHNLDLERHVLGSMLTFPDLLDAHADSLGAGDFYSETHGEIYAVLTAMRTRGDAIDTVNLRTTLYESGALQRLGGDEYLLSLTDGEVSRAVPVNKLRRLSCLRHLEATARALAIAARTGEDTRALSRVLEEAQRALEAIDAPSALPSLADIVEGLAFDPRRIRTMLPTLDAALRGGLAPAKMVTIVGAPGACKTSLAAWLCSEAEMQGACAMYVAADEARPGIITRLGQQHGFDRDALESPMKTVRAQFANDLRTHRPNLHVIDPLRDRLTLEEAARKLEASARAQEKVAVLVVDSLQVVPSAAQATEEGERARLTAVIKSCRAIADRGVVVIAISEMNRGGYRSASSVADGNPLASGAGSSAIEYQADLQLSLSGVKDEPGVVAVSVNKNRIGSDKPELRIRLDFARATFSEAELPPEPSRGSAVDRLGLARRRVLDVVRAYRDLRSQRDVLAHCDGARSANADAYRDLLRTGELALVDGVLRVALSQNGGAS